MLPVSHGDLATLGDVRRRQQLYPEEPVDVADQGLPFGLGLGLTMDLEAEVPKYLSGLALPDQDVDPSGLPLRLDGGQPGHGWKKGDADIGGCVRDLHTLLAPAVLDPQRPTVERFLVRIVKLEPA